MFHSISLRRIAPRALAFSLGSLASLVAQVDPSSNGWVPAPNTWSNPLKVCTTDGYQWGTFCFPYGSAYACGVSTTVTAGTTVSLSASFGANGATVGATSSYTFSQAFSHTAGRCERCQLYICYANSSLQHWECECFLDWYSWRMSYDVFTPGDGGTVRPSCVGDLTCPGCRPPASTPTLGSGPLGAVVPGSGISFDLTRSFQIASGHPEPGHPIYAPHDLLQQLMPWHLAKLAWTVDEAERQAGHGFQYLMLREAGGLAHLYDLTLGPGPFGNAGFFVEESRSQVGRQAPVLIDGGERGQRLYLALASLGKQPGIPLGNGLHLPLNPDLLFELSLTVPGVFQGFQGQLGPDGRRVAWIAYPPEPLLMGLQFYVSGVVFDPLVQQIEAVSPAHRVTVR
ncbi:MAG: hypothetical protein IPN34_16105 [Planctomycetes bacterium]|nr:hypothetical protein [Planctomycetota bacterium]